MKQTSKDRFLAKVRIDEVGCWIWTASKYRNGYGGFSLDGKMISACHAAHMLFIGPIPDGQVVRHICDIKLCVNPRHLLLGTLKDNNIDTVERGHSTRKLTQDQVEMVRRNRQLSSRLLADLLHVSRTVIGNIWLGKTYNATIAVPSRQTPPSVVNAEGKEKG